jgi:molybdopterin-guanine dinucleotide biosynthesis protein A
MGRAKAWLPWFGRTMVEHVVSILRPAVDEVVVVSSDRLDLPELDARVVRDRETDQGPLVGLREGLAATRADLAFVTSTDAPFLTTDYVDAMLARGVACAPVVDGFVQVLCAVYPGTAGSRAAALIEQGVRRPLDLLEALDYQALPEGSGDAVGRPSPWRGFNTPEEYLEAAREVDPEAWCEIEMLGRTALRADPPMRRLPVGLLGDLVTCWPESLGLVEDGRISKRHLVSLGGRDLVRDLSVPIGPGERVSVIDALAGG